MDKGNFGLNDDLIRCRLPSPSFRAWSFPLSYQIAGVAVNNPSVIHWTLLVSSDKRAQETSPFSPHATSSWFALFPPSSCPDQLMTVPLLPLSARPEKVKSGAPRMLIMKFSPPSIPPRSVRCGSLFFRGERTNAFAPFSLDVLLLHKLS